MTHYAHYPIDPDGMSRHWLACGVIASPLTGLEAIIPPDGTPFGAGGRWIVNYWAWHAESKALKARIYDTLPPPAWRPDADAMEPSHHAPGVTIPDGVGGDRWRYAAAESDGAIDFSRFNFNPARMQGWLFARLEAERAVNVEAELLTIGPARVTLNGAEVLHDTGWEYVALRRVPLTLDLRAGANALYLQGEMLGWREARLALGLRLMEPASGVRIALPIGETNPDAWARADAGLHALRVEQFAFPTLPGYVSLDARAREPFTFEAEVRLPIPENVYRGLANLRPPVGHITLTLQPGERGELPIAPEVQAGMSGMPGENSLMLTLRPADGTPIMREQEIWAGAKPFSHQPYNDYESRRREAIDHLAAMPFDVMAAIAALDMGKIDAIPSEAIGLACHFMEQRNDCADFYAIGLLTLLYRYGDHAALAAADRARIESAFRGFKYWIDEPGIDAMCYFTENHQILFFVTAYLAGQRWPDWTFANSGFTGNEQRERARPRIENWIGRRLRGNFSEWDSNAYLALDVFALLALVEFADEGTLRERATTLIDKIFFLLASQSFRGALGSTHGRCYAAGLKSARVENTSALGRIAWGMGLFNGETRATGMLATARRYRVPEVIQRIGMDTERTLVTRARSRERFLTEYDMRDDEWDVTTLTVRTSDAMLSAALDYQPGTMGIQEHLWQAMLSPEAVVFTTYPGNNQEHGSARPNYWAGSARQPRVGMVTRTVVCLYRLEPNVGMGFSHVYFPTAAFDEWRLEGQWAFARVRNGYVALWGDGDLLLTTHGKHAGQELISGGAGAAWISTIGRAADDGTFADFQQACRANPPHADGASASWITLDGEPIAFAWEGAMTISGRAVDWSASPHYQNAYTNTPMDAEVMTIMHDGLTHPLRLKG